VYRNEEGVLPYEKAWCSWGEGSHWILFRVRPAVTVPPAFSPSVQEDLEEVTATENEAIIGCLRLQVTVTAIWEWKSPVNEWMHMQPVFIHVRAPSAGS
jgi:hypothetical protein